MVYSSSSERLLVMKSTDVIHLHQKNGGLDLVMALDLHLLNRSGLTYIPLYEARVDNVNDLANSCHTNINGAKMACGWTMPILPCDGSNLKD